MIKRGRNDVEETIVEDIHDGVGKVKVRQLLGYEPLLPLPGHPEDFDSCIRFMHETTLLPRASIGLHSHEGNEELYYVLEGKGLMTVNEESVEMNPGDVCLTKSGSSHSFKNIGEGELRIIVLEGVVRKEGG